LLSTFQISCTVCATIVSNQVGDFVAAANRHLGNHNVMKYDEFLTLWEPWQLMLETLTFIPQTLMATLCHGPLSALTHWHAFQDWFANIWAVLGMRFAEGSAPVVRELLSHARGIVLDIGPGAGNSVHLYPNPNAKASAKLKESAGSAPGGATAAAMTKIYGAEPNPELHASLAAAEGQGGRVGWRV
jgi:hypothetical protein